MMIPKGLTQKEFNALSKEQRLEWLKQYGTFLANRDSGLHVVSLFVVDGLFVELYKRRDTHTIDYIDIQKNAGIINSYGIDIEKYL